MVAIVTGTIRPTPLMGQLVLKDEKERLQQYVESLQFLIDTKAFNKIVFCENSNYGVEDLRFLIQTAAAKEIELELFSFPGDTEQACIHGKGYGEGEIMKYVFEHSNLIEDESFFVKITGRLKVDNIRQIVKKMNCQKTYFNIPNRTKREIYDTRIYGMPMEQFKKFFLEAYGQVMDSKGVFLEHVYTTILLDEGIKVYNFPKYPRIVGSSGSSGVAYEYVKWKCRIRDFLSVFNLYKVKGQ